MKILQISNKAPYPPNDGGTTAVYKVANWSDLHFGYDVLSKLLLVKNML
ncbi:MAG: hypothetical protein Q8M29_10145 [Bacteroidota bacterium]|nr:hypothetical protein [Bacteroidota bacterium]